MLKKALIRAIIPFSIMTVLSIIMKFQKIEAYQVKSTFIVGIIVAAVAGGSVIYEIEEWTLLKQSIIHFLLMLITVYPCLLKSGRFPLDRAIDYLKVFGIFVFVGLILWSLSYLIFGKILAK